jgi:hypothetical protein
MRSLCITISIDTPFSVSDLKLRHVLEDTIESRGLGRIWDSNISHKAMELHLDADESKILVEAMSSLLDSLGFKNRYNFTFSDPDDIVDYGAHS